MVWLFLRLLTTTLCLGLALIGVLSWQAYDVLVPKASDEELFRRTVVQAAIQKAVAQMPPENPVRRLAIADLVGDRAGAVKRLLAEELRRTGTFTVVDETFVQKMVKEVLEVARTRGLVSQRLVEELERAGISSLEAAIELANRMGVDGVLFGEVGVFVASADRAQVTMQLRIADARTNRAAFGGTFAEAIDRGGLFSPYLRARVEDAPLGMRLFTWVVFTTLMPLVFSYVLSRFFRQESNLINLLILVGLTLVDTLLAFALLGFKAASVAEQVLLMLAFIGGLTYNYVACSQLAHINR